MGDAPRETYERIGRQLAEGIAALLSALTQNLRGAEADAAPVEALRAEVASLQARLERLEEQATSRSPASPPAVSAGEEGGATGARRGSQATRRGRRPAQRAARKAQRRRRTPKAEVRERALAAGRLLAARGQRVNLRTVADAAGLNYGQVTYAFQRKENLLRELGLLEQEKDGQID